MTTPHQTFSTKPQTAVHHLFIVDQSYRTSKALSRLNSQINDSLDSLHQATARHSSQNHYVTMMIIDNGHITCLHHNRNIDELQGIHLKKGKSRKTTLILDSIGSCIATWRALGHHRSKNDRHQVSIFSPIQDKGSQKYNLCNLKMIIQSLSDLEWQFTLIAESPLVPLVASQLNINNYYISKSHATSRDRNFLISQLKRQWRKQQVETKRNSEHQAAA